MTHRERVERALHGEKVDRPPVTVWRHFYDRESSMDGLVDSMIEFQRRFDWDLVKINPRASYHVEDWGLSLKWSQSETCKHEKLSFPVACPEDWDRIVPLPMSSPTLAAHRDAIWRIRKSLGRDIPILMTVFSPLSLAADLTPSDEFFRDQLRTQRTKVLSALGAITETFVRFAAEARDAGADGIFYATTTWGGRNSISWEEYTAIARDADLRILGAVEGGLNLLHVCGAESHLSKMSDYPVDIVNWDDADPTNPPLDRAGEILGDKVAMGGVDFSGWLRRGAPPEVSEATRLVARRMRERERFILGPGCAIDPETPVENIAALRRTVDELATRGVVYMS